MAEINNLGSVRTWLRTCPSIAQAVPFGADYLADDPNKYALVSVPSTRNMLENILGEIYPAPVQTQNFVLAYRAPYGDEPEQNLANLALFQSVERWIMAQSAAGNLPEWDGGVVKYITPTISPVIMEVGASTARYQIQIAVTYQTK